MTATKRPRGLKVGDAVTTPEGRKAFIERIVPADGFLITETRFVVWLCDTGDRERLSRSQLTRRSV